ncbi:MAG: hypothetical protein ACOC40_01370 [Thermoplasmatota archaeon]
MNRQFFDEFRKSKYLNLSDVSSTEARGSSYTGYSNQKTFFSGEISDAAKAELVALSSVEEVKLAPGNFQYNARYRSIYPDHSAVSFTSGEPTSSDVDEYSTSHKDGVIIEPTQESVQTYVQWNANRNNVDDLFRDKQEELSYALATKVENYILNDSTYGISNAATVPTDDSERGAFVVYAGSNTSDTSISEGDVFDLDMLNEARTVLMSKTQYYRDGGYGSKKKSSSVVKNPWRNEQTDPFVAIIGPEQEQALLGNSNITNVDQYGGREPLLNGEIGKIYGIKLVMSQYIPTTDSGDSAWDGSGNASTDLARCILMKGRAAYTFVWGQEPTFEIGKNLERTKDQVVLWTTYAGNVVHDDAIVFMDCALN